MRVVNRKQMQEIDKETIDKIRIPSVVLMENAGLAVLEVIYSNYLELARKGVVVVCGSGNNGGDGMVVARHLFLRGINVKVYLVANESKLKQDPVIQLNILKSLKVPVFSINDMEDEAEINQFLQSLSFDLSISGLVVDALIGTGIRGDIGKLYSKVIETINKYSPLTISVDVPSGLDVDTGKFLVLEPVRAAVTVTFAYPKLGLFLYPAYIYVGKLVVANISIPYVDKLENPNYNLILPFDVVNKIPNFLPNYHKYKVGSVLFIGGSLKYTGAIALACKAAKVAGSGMVFALVDKSIHSIVASKLLEEVVDYYDKSNYEEILNSYYSKVSVIVFGNGIEDNSLNFSILKHILSNFEGVLVIDGTGINMFYDYFIKMKNEFSTKVSRIILTPHSGELSLFFTKTSDKVKISKLDDFDRLNSSLRLANLVPNSVIVSKGNPTFISYASNNVDNVWINLTNGLSLAKAGSGDVLAGIIGSFIAVFKNSINKGVIKDEVIEAIKVAVFVHGLSAQLAKKDLTTFSVTSNEIINYIPKAYKFLFEKYANNVNLNTLIISSKSIIEYLSILDI
jgi:NAD(P)H-hydrate epimerase